MIKAQTGQYERNWLKIKKKLRVHIMKIFPAALTNYGRVNKNKIHGPVISYGFWIYFY